MKRGILDTIGSPLVQVESPPGSVIAAKIESKNPGGSAKDRPALAMVEAAEAAGELESGDRIVEPTSGNTGIGLSVVAAAKGYDITVVMPASKSPERRRLMSAYGADLELVEGTISDAKDRADELEADAGMVQLRQFENPANPEAHYRTTGTEILEQVGDRQIDALVAGIGTGGRSLEPRNDSPRPSRIWRSSAWSPRTTRSYPVANRATMRFREWVRDSSHPISIGNC